VVGPWTVYEHSPEMVHRYEQIWRLSIQHRLGLPSTEKGPIELGPMLAKMFGFALGGSTAEPMY